MAYAIPKDILQMTPRERWNCVYRKLAQQRTVDAHKYWIAMCIQALDFECLYWIIDEYGMKFDVYGERFLFVKRRITDKYGYVISRFGVERVTDWHNDD